MLVDYGLNLSVGPGFNLITGPSYPTGPQYSQHQPFTVTDGAGWNLDSLDVVVMTWLNNDPSAYMRFSIYANDGSGMPTGAAYGSDVVLADYFFETGLPVGSVETIDLSGVYLPAGDYLVVGEWDDEISNPSLDTGWIQGTLPGPNQYGLNVDTGDLIEGASGPLSMQLHGQVVPTPASLFVILGAGLARRRRRA